MIDAGPAVGAPESSRLVSEALRDHRLAMLRGHGSFAVGRDPEEALGLTSVLGATCRILVMARQTGAEFERGRSPGAAGGVTADRGLRARGGPCDRRG